MAEYILGFNAETGAAIRNIDGLKKEIARVTKEFNNAEAGSSEFIQSASNLSQLNLGLKTARSAVADIDKAYRDLNKAIEANFAVHTKAASEASKYHRSLLQIAEDSFRAEDRLRDKNFRAELDDWDRRLKLAVAAKNKIAAQEKAIMEFRAGMGARGAIPSLASPIQGSIDIAGSPEYIKAQAREYEQAYQDLLRAADTRARAIAEFRSGMAERGAISGVASPIRGGADIIGSPDFLQPSSLGRLENQLTKLKEEARRISPNSDEWRAINKEAIELERGIERIKKRQRLGPTMRQRAGAAGGAFLYGGGLGGGAGSALGGIAGGLAGGVPGAFAGAAIGQVVDNLGVAIAGITSQAASVQQLQRGLALASVNASDFAQAQAAVAEMSQRILLPLEQTTRLFTQLRVNTKQYGLTVQDTAQIMEGTALAISATGGSAQDLEGAMRAVVQIMSKGGVQAEELRGQLGERFPGAVVKFAQANKMSFEELQQGLENGEIGIRQFVEFAKKNYNDYAKFSEQLATAPEFAGRRLQIALEQIGIAIGSVFTEAGADIQDTLTDTLNAISRFVKGNEAELKTIASGLAALVKLTEQAGASIARIIGNDIARAFQGVADAAITLRNMTGGGDIRSVSVERQRTNARINEQFAAIAQLRKEQRYMEIPEAEMVLRSLQKRRGELDKQFRDMGGNAAYALTRPEASLTFGGPGANMPIDRSEEDTEEERNLEAFERLRDQLANAYNRAEIERIKQRYELEKRLRDDLYDRQEAGANRLQRQALGFLRALVRREDERAEAVMQARLNVMEHAGSVAGGAGGMGSVTSAASAVGAYLQGNIGPTSTGPHFDVKRVGGGYFPRNYLDQYVQVNGRPLSSGVTVPGGTFAGHQRRGSHGWDYVFGAGRHAATLTGGAQWAEGFPTAHGEARRFRLPSGEMFQFLHGRSEGIGAGAPRKVGGNEARDTMAQANVDIAKGIALETERNAQLLKNSALMREFAQFAAEAYGVPDLELDNRRLAERNRLMEEGLDENTINYRLRLLDIAEQEEFLKKRLPEFIKQGNYNEEERTKILDALADAIEKARIAEKGKNDETLRGIEIQRQNEIKKRINDLKTEISILLSITDEEKRLNELRAEKLSEAQAQEIFNLEKIKKNIEETRALIDDFVTSTSSDYKGFLKAVISGEDAADALKQFQEGLKDKVLTIFLDFAMKPVENFMQEALRGIFLPKNIPDLDGKPQAASTDPVTAMNDNTNATRENTEALKAATASQQQAQTANTALPAGLDKTFAMGNLMATRTTELSFREGAALDFAGTGGVMETIQQQFKGLSDSGYAFSGSLSSMEESLPSWNDAIANSTGAFKKASEDTKNNGASFQESLGKTVAGIGIAAGSIMGIAAGVSQIKEGGAANVLGGIGSILLGIGGGIGGFASLFKAANGAVWKGGFRAFANGGTVTGPTLGLVGEGKYNEAIVPLPDGRSIPVQMKGQSSSRELLGSSTSSSIASPMLSMSFQSTTINGVEYVDRGQLEVAMAETRKLAARDGASRGASLALDRLQNSPSARRKVGIR